MKYIKSIIIILLVCIIIVSALLIYSIKKQERIMKSEDEVIELNKNIEILRYKDIFYIVQNCAQEYVYYNANRNNLVLLNIIDKKYIENKNITQNNVYNYVEEYNSNQVVFAEKIYTVQDDYELDTYYLCGKIIDTNTKQTKDFYLGVRLDTNNDTFSILPYQYMVENDLIEIYEGKEVSNIDASIDKNEYNNYEYVQMTEEKASERFLKDYIFLAIYLPDEAYNHLDDSIKQNEFKDLNSYKQYIEENNNRIKNAILRTYKVNYYDDYTEYIIIDNFGYKYIFKETELLQYTITLE